MCQTLKIPYDSNHVNKICNVRNELLHEGHWSGFDPLGTGTIEQFVLISDIELLIERIIPKLMGFNPKYSESSWIGARTWQLWK